MRATWFTLIRPRGGQPQNNKNDGGGMTRDVPISGTCDPKFAAVEEAFRRNMAEGDPVCGEEVGAGLVHWHPKGGMLRHLMEEFWKDEHLKRGYQRVYTPHLASEKLYEISGHLENYAEWELPTVP